MSSTVNAFVLVVIMEVWTRQRSNFDYTIMHINIVNKHENRYILTPEQL
jgi:hypothetical protein